MKKITETTEISRQIENTMKEIRDTPYHKGTEHYIGRLRARIARLRDKQNLEEGKKSGGGGTGYAVKHQGDATVILVGPPSVGKSTLLNNLTNAQSKVAPYAFTTVSVIPGMMEFKNARIQILDVPGLIEGAEEGKGRGREVLSVARGSDLIIIMTEVGKEQTLTNIRNALVRNGIRINEERPKVTIDKKLGGGLIIHSNIKQGFDKTTIKEIASEFGVKNAEITIKEKLSLARLIDSFSKNRVYLPAIYVVNKIDLKKPDSEINTPNSILISAENNIGINELKNAIWNDLLLLTVYLVREKEEPHLNNPIVMKKNQKLTDVMDKLGSDFKENKKAAIIWGNGAKYPGQEVSLNTQITDGLQIRFI